MTTTVAIKDKQDLLRDMSSGAIISSAASELEKAKKKKEQLLNNEKRLSALEEGVATLNSKFDIIIGLLQNEKDHT